MNITPMSRLNSINELSKIADKANVDNLENRNEGGLAPFKEVFADAVNNYKDSEDKVSQDIQDLALGKTDDLHNLMINMKKADMALDIFVQLRNKSLDAYKELMGINM